jgi:poly(beta-D-mannuronate) lyase
MKGIALITAALIIAGMGTMTRAQESTPAPETTGDADAAEEPTCFDATAPVIKLSYPSRYAEGSENRADFDEAANAAVDAALEPVDDFIIDLAKTANLAIGADPENAPFFADCVLGHLASWADAGALSQLDSQGAKLSVPGRIAGIAIAYAQVRALLPDDDRNAAIETWLADRIAQTQLFFDTDAPPRASENNLRAWAGLAATQVGLLRADDAMVKWGADSIRLVACTANADGSLPNEMWRGKLALHYQIHAISPLVYTAALLANAGQTAEGVPETSGDTTPPESLFEVCDQAIIRAAQFTVAAAKDPKIVETITGERQSFKPGPDDLKSFEFAWITAFLHSNDDPQIAAFGAQFDDLSNSKLGGKQSLIWK